MKVETFTLGPALTNAYLIYADKQGVVVDPGMSPQTLLKRIQELSLNIDAILITHAHFDHIGGLEEMRSFTQAPVYIHRDEQNWLIDPLLNGSRVWPDISDIVCNQAEYTLAGGERLLLAEFDFQVLHTPGHSPGSLTYVLGDKVFSGDILFQDSVGRTDQPGRSFKTLLKSINTNLMPMSAETKIFPGHGPSTTVGREREQNPFLNYGE